MVSVKQLAVAMAQLALATAASTQPKYKDASQPVDVRVKDLLSRMSTADKVAQLMQGDITDFMNITTGEFNSTGLKDMLQYKAGSVYIGQPSPADMLRSGVEYVQKYLVEETELGIPAFIQTEGIHGALVINGTIFPSPIAMAGSFDPDLVHEIAEVVAQEAALFGASQIFAPVVDLARELRWGRVEENYGEDPYLTGEMGHAFVTGLQKHNVSAMVKHFAGFGSPMGGLNIAPVAGGERDMRSIYLRPFHRTIIDGEATSIMVAYSSYDGVPAVTDYHLITEILKEEWGYDYFTMTDAGGSDLVATTHHQAAVGDEETISELILNAGVDVEMGGGSFNFKTIPKLVKDKRVALSRIDDAVSRVLRAKFRMGLFENPTMKTSYNMTLGSQKELSRRADTESIVLLKNTESLLPIKSQKKIALIGPHTDFMAYGDYVVKDAANNGLGVTPKEGITAAAKSRGIEVNWALGCERWSTDTSGFSDAEKAIKDSDVAVVMVGTWSRDQNELWAGYNATTGEHIDISSLDLVGAQHDLVKTVIATGIPTVVVIVSGKPVTASEIYQNATAVVQQFYPGQEYGNAIADILFGDVNPSGRLSVSIPHSVGTLPNFYNYPWGGRPSSPGHAYPNGTLDFGSAYVLDDPVPVYSFGYGLSYTNFTYGNITISPNNFKSSKSPEVVNVSLNVTNSGDVDGKEVVQVYASDLISSVVTPNIALQGFKKVDIKAGETAEVTIPINMTNLEVWSLKNKWELESGDFLIQVGSSSTNILQSGNLTVTR